MCLYAWFRCFCCLICVCIICFVLLLLCLLIVGCLLDCVLRGLCFGLVFLFALLFTLVYLLRLLGFACLCISLYYVWFVCVNCFVWFVVSADGCLVWLFGFVVSYLVYFCICSLRCIRLCI